MPPFLHGYSGPNLEASSHVEAPFGSGACRADRHRGRGSPWFRESKLMIFPEALFQGSLACREPGMSGSVKAGMKAALKMGKQG